MKQTKWTNEFDHYLIMAGKSRLKYNTLNKKTVDNIKLKYNIHSLDDEEEILQWMREYTYPPLPPEQEIIPMNEWDIDGLQGQSKEIYFHPHNQFINKYIIEHFQPKHDILTILGCSQSKPYSENKLLKRDFYRKFSEYTDFATNETVGLCPIEYSNYYPIRYSNWNHYLETPEVVNIYCTENVKHYLEFFRRHKYKHVIVMVANQNAANPFNYIYEHNLDNAHDWMHIIFTEQVRKDTDEYYWDKFQGKLGLIHSRYYIFKYTRDIYKKTLLELYNGKD